MEVKTKPREYGVNASYDGNGRNPRITVNLRGEWSVRGIGVNGIGAHGTYEMSFSKVEGERFDKPNRLELKGIISEDIPEEKREGLAKDIKYQLKQEIKAMLEKTHGHLSFAINKVW